MLVKGAPGGKQHETAIRVWGSVTLSIVYGICYYYTTQTVIRAIYKDICVTIHAVWKNHTCQWDDCMECVTIELENHNFEVDKNIIFSVIDRPPNTDRDVFVNTLNTLIEKIKCCYFLGDYEINILNYATHSRFCWFNVLVWISTAN